MTSLNAKPRSYTKILAKVSDSRRTIDVKLNLAKGLIYFRFQKQIFSW